MPQSCCVPVLAVERCGTPRYHAVLRAEKESVLADLQKRVKLLTQAEAASSKQQKALEAQVSQNV